MAAFSGELGQSEFPTGEYSRLLLEARTALCLAINCQASVGDNDIQPCMAGIPAESIIEAHFNNTGCPNQVIKLLL